MQDALHTLAENGGDASDHFSETPPENLEEFAMAAKECVC
jgi:hypothetical protein